MRASTTTILSRRQNRFLFVAAFIFGVLTALGFQQWNAGGTGMFGLVLTGVALSGLIWRTILHLHRVEERREVMEGELRASRSLLNSIVENIPDMIFVKDAKDLRFVLFNRAGEKLLGFSRGDLIGKNDYDFFPKDQADFFTGKDRQILESNILLDIPEEPIETKFLGKRYLHTKKLAILGEEGRAKYLLGISEDITERTLARRQLEEHQKMLLISAKMSALGEMAGSIAHEINNPLLVILGKAEQLREVLARPGADPAQVEEVIGKIETTAKRISKIVKGLRTFAREGEKDPFQLVSVAALVEETLSLCTQRFLNHGIRVDVGAIPEGLAVQCRAVQVSQVLLNLLGNAFDAVDNAVEKWVRLDFVVHGNELHLYITDSGPGIPPEIRDKIMQPFFSTKEIGKGTGLGLSISKGIIEDHRGKLALSSAGPNTQFIVTLPLRQNESSPQAVSA